MATSNKDDGLPPALKFQKARHRHQVAMPEVTGELLRAFTDAITAWSKSPACQKGKDLRALLDVLQLIEDGQPVKAYDKAWDLDTIVREQIPDCIWDFWNELDLEKVR
jgi:hypothetical protein